MEVWGIILAAGSGSRYGGKSLKQCESFAGETVVAHSLRTAVSFCDGAILVTPDGSDIVDHQLLMSPMSKPYVCVRGGKTRSESVRSGLSALPDSAEIVVVHDAARPLASVDLYQRVVSSVRNGADAAIPGIAVTDTIKRVHEGIVIETLDRSELVAVQTPQAFRTEVLRQAHATNSDATDDAALLELLGHTVHVVEGEYKNQKITYFGDVERLQQL